MAHFIRNATYLDVETGRQAQTDILIRDGSIAAMGEALDCPADAELIEAQGMYVTTGWIDSHVHLYSASGFVGVSGDDMLKNGVTYVQEAGSAGPLNFEDYLNRDVLPSKQRIKSYVYLAPMGMSTEYSELRDLSVVDLDACQRAYEAYPEHICGIKMRIDPRICCDALAAMELGMALKERTGLPMIIHASRCVEPMDEIMARMGKGDIYAHIFANKLPGVLDADGRVKKSVWDAQKRGVYFDLAHGTGNFSAAVARSAISQGFLPDSVSTDLHGRSLPKLKSLAATMSKAIACGMSLQTVLKKVTVESARMLGITDKQLSIQAGKPADLVLFRVLEQPVELLDSDGVPMECPVQIQPCVTFLGDGCYRPDPLA